MGSVSECCACGAEYRGFPVSGIIICQPCADEMTAAIREMESRPEDDDTPDPGIVWFDTSDELK